MTAIRGYVAPTTETDALGVHSLDQFVLAVPDASVAQDFYGQFRPRRAARRQRSGHQDLRPRAPLGLGGGGQQDQGAAPSFVRLLRRGHRRG